MRRLTATLGALLVATAPALADVHLVPRGVGPVSVPGPARLAPAALPVPLAPLPAHAAPAALVVPIVLPPPPPVTNAATSTLSSALLAIAQAQSVNPSAAQTASFQYIAALQQYRSGNVAAARISALAALSTASQAQVRVEAPAPLPTPALVSAPAQLPGTEGGLYGADAPAIDAGSFLALARGIISDCATRHDHRLAAARAAFTRAQNDFAARNFEATRLDAKAAIDACAQPQP
jgi:hypothetical protein